MMKQLGVLALLGLMILTANAADNSITVTVGSGPTLRSVDIGGGVQAPGHVIVNSAGTNIVGAGTTLPISGTLTAITNSVAVTGTFWQTTQPVSGTGTFAVQLTGATNNINNITGTVSLPTGAATSALQTTGNTSLTTINTTLGTPFQAGGNIGNTTFAVTQATAASLNMTCANCSGSGASGTDEGGFTAGSSVFAPAGGFFQTTATSNPLTTGQWGAWQMTANRAGFVNLRTAAGVEIGVAAAPVQVSLANTGSNVTAVSVSLAANQSVNEAQINGVTPLMGNGATGTGSQRVTIASDNTAFGVNATLQASATTAIGKVDPNTIATWGLVVSTQNSATPTNGQLIEGQFNTTPTTLTSGNVSPLQMDNAGNLKVVGTGIAQGSTTSGQTGSLVMGAVTTSAPSYTTAQSSPLSLDAAGNLRVNVVTGGGSGGTSSADKSAWTVSSTVGTQIQGEFTTSGATACATAQACTVGMTAGRGLFTDLSTVNAVTVLTGTGAVGTGAQRVAVGTDTATIAGSAPSTVLQQNSAQYAGTAVAANPCLTGTISYIPISQATSTQVASLGGSSKKNYICAINLVGADAENISVVEGTGTVCATTTAAIIGGTTAANGWNFAANSGISQGNGAAPVAAGALTSLNNVCVFQSGTGRVAGSIVLAQQ